MLESVPASAPGCGVWAERSMSGSSPQSWSPLCLRQGLSLAWSTLCRLDYLASESWGFTCSTSVSSPPDTMLNFLNVGSGG